MSHDAVRLSTLRAPQEPPQNGAPPPVLVAPSAAQRPRAASPPALIAAPPPATPPAADQRSRDATTFAPPSSQPFAFNIPSFHRKKPPNLMDIQLPDLSEAIQSRVANDSDDNSTPPDLQRRRPQRKRKSPSNLKDYYVGLTTSTFGAAQINSEYNSNVDLTIGYSYSECGTSTSASHANFVYNTLSCDAQLDVNNYPNSINQTNYSVSRPQRSRQRVLQPQRRGDSAASARHQHLELVARERPRVPVRRAARLLVLS